MLINVKKAVAHVTSWKHIVRKLIKNGIAQIRIK